MGEQKDIADGAAREFAPAMTPGEVALLTKVIPQDASVLEFGSGGSTQLFFERGAHCVVSVESDKRWLEKLTANPLVAVSHKYGRWLPLHANIGEVGDLGAPVSAEPQACWLNYHQYCWDHFAERKFSLVLVDGRFRVACLCQTLLRCANENMLIAIHDFWNRPQYHVVLEFLDCIEREDSLGVFKPKGVIAWQRLALVLQGYQFDAE